VLVEFVEALARDELRKEVRVKVRSGDVVDEEIVEGVETVAVDEKLGNALVVVAEGLDLLVVSGGGNIGDEGGRATGHLNSQFMIVLQKHYCANISKREGERISTN
jgi:hypothetical protein